MFHTIPQAVRERMTALEQIDARDRADGTPQAFRLRQIPVETGKLLALLLASAPAGEVVEVGTSAGYSTLWLSLAGRPITTIEISPEKVRLARETFQMTGLAGRIQIDAVDARSALLHLERIAFCFLDAEKDIYSDCYEAVVPRLVPGGILAADNVISHQDALQPFLARVQGDERVDALVVPIGKGLLVCRKE
jgi:caffeoyl-CoA O-methyltransferase